MNGFCSREDSLLDAILTRHCDKSLKSSKLFSHTRHVLKKAVKKNSHYSELAIWLSQQSDDRLLFLLGEPALADALDMLVDFVDAPEAAECGDAEQD